MAFNGYLAQLAWPTIALGWTLASIQRGLAAMARVAEVLDERGHDGVAARPHDGLDDGLSAEGPERSSADWSAGAISGPPHMPKSAPEQAPSSCPADRSSSGASPSPTTDRGPVLRDVSFTVAAGAVVAVVGPTGSGKSTLGALLCRLYEPPRGTVWVGGHDVRDLPLGRLRRSVGYVPQESFLFSRSLRDNVRLADESAGPERLEAVARTAGLTDDLGALPRGWDTVVGERGLTLSGGQRQRVALARALVADPPFLVLDDVLASVDAAKECGDHSVRCGEPPAAAPPC